MTTHLTDTTILAVRDGLDVDAEAEEHLRHCAVCRASLEAAEGRSAMIGRALAALDDAPAEQSSLAKTAVRARLDEVRGRHISRRRWPLGRAAALVLLSAGTASALTVPPVREWLASTFSATTPPRPEAPPAVVEPLPPVTRGAEVRFSEPVPTPDRDVSISVAVPDTLMLVRVDGAERGTEVVVRWTESGTASLTAPPGSRFTYQTGLIEADVTSGPIHIELPRSGSTSALEVGGQPYLVAGPDRVEITAHPRSDSAEGLTFVVGAEPTQPR